MDRVFRIDFYPAEWLVQTSNLSPGQRGIFIQIVAMIYANKGAIENDAYHIGRVSGCSSRFARSVIDQLASLGFIQFSGSKITQKRCELELNIMRTRHENSSKGGRTKAEKEAESKENNGLRSSGDNESLCAPSHHISPHHTIREDAKASLCVSDTIPDDFEEFWSLYPRKVAKPNAQKAYLKSRKKGATHEEIIDGLRKYIASVAGKDPTYIAHGASWLNAERWKDVIPTQGQTVNGKSSYGNSIKNAARTVFDLLENEERVRAQAD